MQQKKNVIPIIQETIKKIQPNSLLLQKLYEINFKQTIEKSNSLLVISMGKAGFNMGSCFYEFLKNHYLEYKLLKGFIVTPYQTKKSSINNKKFQIIESAHPYPDDNSLYAGDQLFKIIPTIPLDTTVILLLSGGASALIEKPINGLDLNKIQNITKQLLKSGASIQEINTIRKKLSLIKGGGLAEILYPRPVYQFILSDVIGEDSEKFVSSGPMYPDDINEDFVWNLIKKYHIDINKNIQFPKKKQSSLKETYIIGNNQIACLKLKEVLDNDYDTYIKKFNFTGNIEEYTKIIHNDIANFLKKPKPYTAFIWGGEPTIKVMGNGKGGRNQELCLRMSLYFDEYKQNNHLILFSSFGTDGIDGPTDACGGVITQNSLSKINEKLQNSQSKYKNLLEILNNNDSYYGLSLINGLIKTGPTGTNLNDLSFFIFE